MILAFLAILAPPADACSCVDVARERWLVEEGAVLPANARGVPWFGATTEPTPSDFALTREGHPLAVTIEPITPDIVGTGAWLVVPQDGWLPGRYRAEFRDRGVGFEVARRRLSKKDLEGALVVAPSELAVLALTVVSGSCSEDVPTVSVDLTWPIAPEAEPFQPGLLYATWVDGRLWRPTSSLCSSLDPGESWRGRGGDRIFVLCASNLTERPRTGQVTYGREEVPLGFVEHGLLPGTHDVRMTVGLAGTDIQAEVKATVDLRCQP